MKNFLRKISDNEIDEFVKNEFVKYSRGRFEGRYLLQAKRQTNKWSIKTSAEFANFFVTNFLETLERDSEIEIKGIIVSTSDLTKDAEFEIEKVKKYMGIQQAIIRTKTSPAKILRLMEKYPRAFYALSFKTNNAELKIKEKPPKSGKPGSKGEDGPKADFCSLKTEDKEIVKDLFFDCDDFKEIKIEHAVNIERIEIPSGISNPVELREKAKRIGVIERKIKLDGNEKINMYNFKI